MSVNSNLKRKAESDCEIPRVSIPIDRIQAISDSLSLINKHNHSMYKTFARTIFDEIEDKNVFRDFCKHINRIALESARIESNVLCGMASPKPEYEPVVVDYNTEPELEDCEEDDC